METIPKALVNHFRGFLPTKDVLLSRRVCKAWRDVDAIPKTLPLDDVEETYPPPEASISNVTKLHIWEMEASEALRLLRMCAPSLLLLALTRISFDTTHMPHFSKVTTLALSNANITTSPSLCRIFQKIPNVKNLVLYGSNPGHLSVDFGLMPDLESITVRMPNLFFQNISQVSLRRILCNESNLGMLSEVVEVHSDARVDVAIVARENLAQKLQFIKDNVRFHHDLWFTGSGVLFSIKIFENEATFTSAHIRNESLEYCTEKLKGIIIQLRTHGMAIRARLKRTSAKTKLIALLTMTNLFSMQELGDLCYQLA